MLLSSRVTCISSSTTRICSPFPSVAAGSCSSPGDASGEGAVASGWASYMYRSSNASENEQGEKLGISPRITTDKETGTVTFFYQGEPLGVEDWRNAAIYITTWEHNAEGEYTEIFEAPSDWSFGGALPESPKVLDDALVVVARK